jgi:type IV secretory pathway VirB10-like protein
VTTRTASDERIRLLALAHPPQPLPDDPVLRTAARAQQARTATDTQLAAASGDIGSALAAATAAPARSRSRARRRTRSRAAGRPASGGEHQPDDDTTPYVDVSLNARRNLVNACATCRPAVAATVATKASRFV